jgi:ABC-type multidrug transport system fused ATPase/permease subunit
VGLVGATGSGKSTVASLACGLYEPWSGEVLLDGRPLKSWTRRLRADSLAVVDQEIALVEGTVLDNLTLWDPTLPEEQVWQAARDACIHDEVMARPEGYGTRVHEGGANFSGGQRQRLEIARALARNPALLILDEATSALDAVTEARIDDHLRRRGIACLIVAHRLSTLRDCDEILVMDAGRVAARGTHEDLLLAGGLYADLVRDE